MMLRFTRNFRAMTATTAAGACMASALVLSGGAGAVEPNNDFATATGPLTAGKLFKASLETADDADFQFFYLPDTTTVTVTTTNTADKKGGGAVGGRTITSTLFRALKGKTPRPIADSAVTVKPGKKDSFTLSLLPGKYFIPVGHAPSTATPLPNTPFKLQIGPVGSTVDSHEIFESRCHAAQRRLNRIKTSIKRTKKHLSKAKRNDAKSHKIVKLKLKLRGKRDKAHSVKKAEKFVCSIPA